MWKLLGEFSLTDLGQGFYVVKFAEMEDRAKVMTGGPWKIMDHYLTVQRWKPHFRPSEAVVPSTSVWIDFPECPVEYFQEDLLMEAAKHVGIPIKIDNTTALAAKARFARVCVEVDLCKPLVSKVCIGYDVLRVEYEGLHTVCFHCGVVGHRAEFCPVRQVGSGSTEGTTATNTSNPGSQAIVPVTSSVTVRPIANPSPPVISGSDKTFGPWFLVPRRMRRNFHNSGNNKGLNSSSDLGELRTLVVNFSKELYTDEATLVSSLPCMNDEWKLTGSDRDILSVPIHADEVRAAVFAMNPHKSPGIDGFPPGFSQKAWAVVGPKLVLLVQEAFQTGVFDSDLNKTLVTLIPKTENPEIIGQFRPISLCTVPLKVISKVLVDRLRPYLSKLVGKTQSSFIPGRQTTDNIIVVQEAIHTMRIMKRKKKGVLAMKIDLEKAYDRIRWSFLRQVLQRHVVAFFENLFRFSPTSTSFGFY
nr:hypothetical protein [Solanum melongena]WMB96868.1 hypothetical protein [Solanum melongena]WMB97045.1 hypothetical protein [Solanum aethiopicum]